MREPSYKNKWRGYCIWNYNLSFLHWNEFDKSYIGKTKLTTYLYGIWYTLGYIHIFVQIISFVRVCWLRIQVWMGSTDEQFIMNSKINQINLAENFQNFRSLRHIFITYHPPKSIKILQLSHIKWQFLQTLHAKHRAFN